VAQSHRGFAVVDGAQFLHDVDVLSLDGLLFFESLLLAVQLYLCLYWFVGLVFWDTNLGVYDLVYVDLLLSLFY
jgi:hypothetical protein